MRRNVSISRKRTKIERLLDWKEFPSKSVGRFSFQCQTDNNKILYNVSSIQMYQLSLNLSLLQQFSLTSNCFILNYLGTNIVKRVDCIWYVEGLRKVIEPFLNYFHCKLTETCEQCISKIALKTSHGHVIGS